MDYVKYSIEIQPREPWVDILMSELSDFGFDTFEETEEGVDAYLPVKEEGEKLSEYFKNFSHDEAYTFRFEREEIPTQNWNAEWESSFEPVIVGDFCNIRADFHQGNSNCQYEILITPKMSFGTGHHPTTFLMVQAMQNIEFSNTKVLDMGTGTGVLGILAYKLQAESVLGIDIEEWAVENAIENAQKNQSIVEFKLGGKEQIPSETYDVILANINRNILLDQLSKYGDVLCSGGKLLLSGFMKEDVAVLNESASKLGLKLINENKKEQWICLVFQKG